MVKVRVKAIKRRVNRDLVPLIEKLMKMDKTEFSFRIIYTKMGKKFEEILNEHSYNSLLKIMNEMDLPKDVRVRIVWFMNYHILTLSIEITNIIFPVDIVDIFHSYSKFFNRNTIEIDPVLMQLLTNSYTRYENFRYYLDLKTILIGFDCEKEREEEMEMLEGFHNQFDLLYISVFTYLEGEAKCKYEEHFNNFMKEFEVEPIERWPGYENVADKNIYEVEPIERRWTGFDIDDGIYEPQWVYDYEKEDVDEKEDVEVDNCRIL